MHNRKRFLKPSPLGLVSLCLPRDAAIAKQHNAAVTSDLHLAGHRSPLVQNELPELPGAWTVLEGVLHRLGMSASAWTLVAIADVALVRSKREARV